MSERPLRILFVNRMVAMERGGGETFDLEMMRHLAGLGCQVSVLGGRPLWGRARLGPKDWWTEGIAKFEVRISNFQIRTPYTGWFPWDKVRGGWRLRAWDFSCFERAAARWIAARSDQFDVIQVCELPELVSELKRRAFPRPVVMRVTAPNVYDPTGGTQKADAVIASGTSIAKYHAGPRPDCVEVPNGVDVTSFRPQSTDFRVRKGMGPDEFVVLYVARFQAFKNHAMLVEAFRLFQAKVPAGTKVRLVLAGSGPLRARVEAQVAQAGLTDRVLFLGETNFAELPAIYATADVMAISSDYESFCFAAIEAMASGLPVVSTDCGWVPKLLGKFEIQNSKLEITEASGGWITPVGDASAFADALLQAWRDPEARARIGRANRRAAEERHTWTASAHKLLDVYQRLCPAHEGPKG